jgi:hypothetical protein
MNDVDFLEKRPFTLSIKSLMEPHRIKAAALPSFDRHQVVIEQDADADQALSKFVGSKTREQLA